MHLTGCVFDTLCVSFSFVFSIYCFVAAVYANKDVYIITKVSNALNTLVSREKPGFQALPKGLIVLLCAEVVRQGVSDLGAVHSECSASNSG